MLKTMADLPDHPCNACSGGPLKSTVATFDHPKMNENANTNRRRQRRRRRRWREQLYKEQEQLQHWSCFAQQQQGQEQEPHDSSLPAPHTAAVFTKQAHPVLRPRLGLGQQLLYQATRQLGSETKSPFSSVSSSLSAIMEASFSDKARRLVQCVMELEATLKKESALAPHLSSWSFSSLPQLPQQPPLDAGASSKKTRHAPTSRQNRHWLSCVGGSLRSVAKEGVIFMAERLLYTQAQWEQQQQQGAETNKKSRIHVDIGYHWTHFENMNRIQMNGLLTKAERGRRKLRAFKEQGLSLGDGIYTASDPYSYCQEDRFGTICFMVARLTGNKVTKTTAGTNSPIVGEASEYTGTNADGVGTFLEHNDSKWCKDKNDNNSIDTIVSGTVTLLKSSSQCIPLM